MTQTSALPYAQAGAQELTKGHYHSAAHWFRLASWYVQTDAEASEMEAQAERAEWLAEAQSLRQRAVSA